MDNIYQKEVRCIFCSENNFKIVYNFPSNRYNHNYYITHSWDGGKSVGLRIVKCKNCSLKYQNPIFKDEYLDLLYPQSIIPEKLDLTHFDKNFTYMWNKCSSFLKKETVFSVDIGTRYGGLPNFLQEKKIHAIGIEMNPACVKAAIDYGFKDIHCGKINNLASILDSYKRKDADLITMIDVIEHLTDINKDFEIISSLQVSGQILVITTMFNDSVGGLLFGKEWYYIHAQHTLYFSKKTITQFLEKYNYEVLTMDNIPLYKSFIHFPKEFIKLLKHKWNLLVNTKFPTKQWFADNRPHCLDLITVIARKK